MCVDAHEAAGQSDRALAYLQELVEWKKKLIDAESCLQYEGLTESCNPNGHVRFDDNLLVRSQRLHAGVHQRIQRFVETAINAEIASGHDLYRTFRVANSRAISLLQSDGTKSDCSSARGEGSYATLG